MILVELYSIWVAFDTYLQLKDPGSNPAMCVYFFDPSTFSTEALRVTRARFDAI